jgi:hypoxanthine phosphoribosyltransferase
MPQLMPVLSAAEIALKVEQLGAQISADYQGRDLVLVAVLKGAFIFLADLVRQLTVPAQIDFLQAASYGGATRSSGKVELLKPIGIDIRGRDVLLVEDIVDTGLTVVRILDHLRSLAPRSLKLCALIDKRERRQAQVPIDYAGHTCEKGFLVGYGLDYAEDYRYLSGIFQLQP